jgi:hypothetical protein
LFSSQSRWIPAVCGYRSSSSYLVDVCLWLSFLGLGTHLSAWSSGKGIGIIVFSALAVFESEVVFLQELNPAGGLFLEVHEILGWFRSSCLEQIYHNVICIYRFSDTSANEIIINNKHLREQNSGLFNVTAGST